MENKELILEFLSYPLDSGDEIFDRFAALPNAIAKKGEKTFERFVYVPGNRKDRVLLVAHIDTVWDKDYQKFGNNKPHNHSVVFENGIFFSGEEMCGIGADDRAGCAMLWKLKDSGHSILILDGEEDGKRGAWFLKQKNLPLYKEINRHSFMLELDHESTDHVSFNQVDNTVKFKNFFKSATGFKERGLSGGCDLQVLCTSICGANVGIGYNNFHTSKEVLILEEWENTFGKLEDFLSQKQPKFKAPFVKRTKKRTRAFVSRLVRRLGLKK